MKIQEQDTYHGPALMQIVEHNSFKALNKADEKYGHYLVNSNVRLWIKYSSATTGPWSFTFQSGDLKAIAEDVKVKRSSTHVVLVCGHHSICCLSSDELEELIDLTSEAAQWVKVDSPSGKQMRITGSSNSKQAQLAPHNKFPSCIF